MGERQPERTRHGLSIDWTMEELACECGWEPDHVSAYTTETSWEAQFMEHLAEQIGERLASECSAIHPASTHVDQARSLLGITRAD